MLSQLTHHSQAAQQIVLALVTENSLAPTSLAALSWGVVVAETCQSRASGNR